MGQSTKKWSLLVHALVHQAEEVVGGDDDPEEEEDPEGEPGGVFDPSQESVTKTPYPPSTHTLSKRRSVGRCSLRRNRAWTTMGEGRKSSFFTVFSFHRENQKLFRLLQHHYHYHHFYHYHYDNWLPRKTIAMTTQCPRRPIRHRPKYANANQPTVMANRIPISNHNRSGS